MSLPFIDLRFSEYPLVNVTLNICFFALAFSLLCCFYRVIKGPTVSDRIISGDAISCNVMALVVLYSIMQDTELFMPAALVTALMGFLGMICMGKYITNGNIIYPMYRPVRKPVKTPETVKEEHA
jgi:multisubunit Na+/H+ antiporter MnhF subunit